MAPVFRENPEKILFHLLTNGYNRCTMAPRFKLYFTKYLVFIPKGY